MFHLTRIRAAGFACALTITASAAAGPLLDLGTEQKAVSSIISATYIEHETTGVVAIITGPAYEYGLLALNALAAVTNPAALSQSAGMTFPCRGGGTFVARSTPASPRNIDVEFSGCLPYRFFNSAASGPLRLSLLSSSFAEDRLRGLRLGTRDRDFIIVIESLTPDQDTFSTVNHNLTMQGLITMPRNQQADGVAATSLYELTGFVNQQDRFVIPGRDTIERSVGNSAEHVLVSTSSTFRNDFLWQEDDTKFLWGTLSLQDLEPTGDYRTRFDLAGLRVRRITDYAAWTGSLALDGAVLHTWPSQAGSGCLSGGYLFDTRTPLHWPNLDSSLLDAGRLLVNGNVDMRAYAPGNVPPGLPAPALGMLLNVNVRGVGAFNYDLDSFAGPAMMAVAQCPY